MVYSSSYEVTVNFTRDYDTVRQALYNIEHYDKVCIESMLQAAGSLLLSNWGTQNYNQVNYYYLYADKRTQLDSIRIDLFIFSFLKNFLGFGIYTLWHWSGKDFSSIDYFQFESTCCHQKCFFI